MQCAPDCDRELAVHPLEMILLDSGDRVGNEIGVKTVDRAAIVPAVWHDSLERRDVVGIAQQLVPRLKVVIKTRTGLRKIIGLVHIRHLMQPAPLIAWCKRIDGMKKRIGVLSANGDCRKDEEKNESGPTQYPDNHKREPPKLIMGI